MHTINIQRKSKNTINSYPANASTFFLILAFRIKKTTPIDNIHNKNVLKKYEKIISVITIVSPIKTSVKSAQFFKY